MWQSKADLPILQTRTLRPEEGRARPRAPLPASSFILWVRSPPPPTGLPERVTGSPQVTQKIPRLSAAAGGLFLLFSMFSMCVADLSPGRPGVREGWSLRNCHRHSRHLSGRLRETSGFFNWARWPLPSSPERIISHSLHPSPGLAVCPAGRTRRFP